MTFDQSMKMIARLDLTLAMVETNGTATKAKPRRSRKPAARRAAGRRRHARKR